MVIWSWFAGKGCVFQPGSKIVDLGFVKFKSNGTKARRPLEQIQKAQGAKIKKFRLWSSLSIRYFRLVSLVFSSFSFPVSRRVYASFKTNVLADDQDCECRGSNQCFSRFEGEDIVLNRYSTISCLLSFWLCKKKLTFFLLFISDSQASRTAAFSEVR